MGFGRWLSDWAAGSKAEDGVQAAGKVGTAMMVSAGNFKRKATSTETLVKTVDALGTTMTFLTIGKCVLSLIVKSRSK